MVPLPAAAVSLQVQNDIQSVPAEGHGTLHRAKGAYKRLNKAARHSWRQQRNAQVSLIQINHTSCSHDCESYNLHTPPSCSGLWVGAELQRLVANIVKVSRPNCIALTGRCVTFRMERRAMGVQKWVS